MKRLLYIFLSISMIVLLISCKNEKKNDEAFIPSLDTKTNCSIKVAGSYGNFEALEAEFMKFNNYYPNVKLSYVKIDDYDNNISKVLDSNDKPNIFFSYPRMIGDDKFNSVINHMENINDTALKSNLDCIRPGLINNDTNGKILMIPVLSRTYGMLINNDLFKKENLDVPTTLTELKNVSNSFIEKGFKSPMMGYTLSSSSSLMNTIAYPLFVATLANNKEALALANDLNPSAGIYMNDALKTVLDFLNNKLFDLEECDKISNNYEKVIFRFFEGDVPMMVCTADTVSGTKKRESQSEYFTKNPFAYSFIPIPLTENGGYFIDSPSIEFSVNKDCNNLDMTNEFMRFLITTKELNDMAYAKGLVSPTKTMPEDSMFKAFTSVSQDKIISPEVIGIKDPLTVQIRIASHKVGRKELTIDEAILGYGSYK